MRYLESRFSVAMPGTSEYASNWERTFQGAKNAESLEDLHAETCADVDSGKGGDLCAEVGGAGVGGCEAKGPEEGEGYPKPPPCKETEGGVSGFPEKKVGVP